MTHNWLIFSENINKERKTIKRIKKSKNDKHSPFNKEAAPEKKIPKINNRTPTFISDSRVLMLQLYLLIHIFY